MESSGCLACLNMEHFSIAKSALRLRLQQVGSRLRGLRSRVLNRPQASTVAYLQAGLSGPAAHIPTIAVGRGRRCARRITPNFHGSGLKPGGFLEGASGRPGVTKSQAKQAPRASNLQHHLKTGVRIR